MASIVHLGKYSFPYHGGIESVTELAAEGAVKAGHVVAIIGFSKVVNDSNQNRSGVLDVRCRCLFTFASQPLGIGYFTEAIRLGRKADIVHLHLPNMLAALAVLFLPSKARVIVHWHSDVVGKGWIAHMLRSLESAVLRRAARIICTSQAYAGASHALMPFRGKVTVVPIGIKDQAPQSAIDSVSKASIEKVVAGRKIVLSVGRLVPYKGFDVLVNAVQNLPSDVVTIIVGDGPLKQPLLALSKELGFSDRVVFWGRADPDVLTELFRRATLFCLPSIQRSEAFGVVLVEAMSYGLPIVATEIAGSGVSWVNAHEVSGINVPPNDPKALEDACLRLIQDNSLRHRLSAGARHRFDTEFTAGIFVSRLLAIYVSALKS